MHELLAALDRDGLVLHRDTGGDLLVMAREGREVVVRLTSEDWDQMVSGVVLDQASAVEEVRRVVMSTDRPRAHLVGGDYSVWLSPYDPGRRGDLG